MKKILALVMLFSALVLFGCGTGDVLPDTSGSSSVDANITPIDFDNDASLKGTYKVIYARVKCTNGVNVESSDLLTTKFNSYYAYDGWYSYYDYVFEYAGQKVLDEGERVVESLEVNVFTTTITQTGPYNYYVNYNGVPVGSGVTCDERFDYRKISNDLKSEYFRVLNGSAVVDMGAKAKTGFSLYKPTFKNLVK